MLNVGKLNLKTGPADYRVPYRNTMLEAVHPDTRLGILEVSQEQDDRRVMLNLLSREYKGMRLDFATGSRKSGSFIITNSELGRRYWRTPEGAVCYGSNLLTTCNQPPQQQPLIVLVVEDGRYQTADCHAKIRPDLLPLFGTLDHAIQFRFMSSLYIGKGTAAPGKPDQEAEIIMPLSCFKSSHKPPTGAHLMQTTWGNVFYSQRRQTKVSYQILQWFTLKAIMDDCQDHIDAEIARLQLASQSPKAAADLLSPETDAEFTFLDVIRADVHDQLKNHPWIVNGLARMIRQRWLHLATGAGLFAKGLMIMPDDTLPDGVVCSPDLTQGPVIAFPYPCLSWWCIKILDVRFSHDHTEPGTVWMNTATAASMQRDFDGDYCQFLYCSEYQAMASEVREWHATRTPPVIPKATKRKASHWNNLPRVAMDSMTCPLGWVTNLITKSNAVGQLDLCSQLAAESQIAVDGLKFDVSNNWRLLRTAQKELPELDWLKEAKSRRTFLHETMSSGSDTIGQLVAYVAPNWTPPQQLARPIEEYAHLMPKPEASQYLGDYAFLAYQNYGKAIAGILAMDDPDEQQREISQLIRTVREWANRLNNPEQVFLHLWQIAHRQRSQDAPPATASICFHAFTERICERLQSPAAAPEVIAIVGLHHNAYNTPNALQRLSGLVDTLTVAETTLKGHVRSIAYLAGKALGIVSSETPTMPGSYSRRLVWNGNASEKSLGTIYASAP